MFSYHCSVFCTTVPFFPQQNKNGTVCFCTTVYFTRNKGTKTEHCVFVSLFCVFVPLFRFCTSVLFFPQQNWLTISNINCMEDEVGIYDSAFDDLPHNEQLVVASLVKTEKKILKTKFSNVYMQTNGNGCGMYAISNATALAFGLWPRSIKRAV